MAKGHVSVLRILPVAAIIAALTLYATLIPAPSRWQPWSGHGDGFDVESNGLADNVMESLNHDAESVSIRLKPQDHIFRPAQITTLEWNVSRENRRLDGVLKMTYLINGQFPGPTVETRSGDVLHITVWNHLEDAEGVAIHWHGLRIANDMDGAVGVTQCAIPTNGSFTYQLEIAQDQAGTFWYHSHSDTQRADGLYGPLIIHRPQEQHDALPDSRLYDYDSEQVLMVGDWHHRPATEVLAWYLDWKNFKMEPVPDSLLLNGKGCFDCSKALRMRPVDCVHTATPHITLPTERTRLRIINTGSLTGFSLESDGSKFTLIGVDGGHPIVPLASSSTGTLYPGERVDLIIEPVDAASNISRWLTIDLDREAMRFPNLALTSTQQFPIVQSTRMLPSSEHESSPRIKVENVSYIHLNRINGTTIEPALAPIPPTPSSTVLLYATISYLTEFEYRPKGFINHTSWLPAAQIADSASLPLLALPRSAWPTDHPSSPLVPAVQQDTWVDIVLNNADETGHPFHLHGQSFYILSTHVPSRPGEYGAYDPFEPQYAHTDPPGGPLNLINPPMKDTVYVPGRGYVVLRVHAQTPGLWLLHCHVIWHQAVGMNAALSVIDGSGQDLLDEQAGSLCAPAS